MKTPRVVALPFIYVVEYIIMASDPSTWITVAPHLADDALDVAIDDEGGAVRTPPVISSIITYHAGYNYLFWFHDLDL